MVVFAIGTHGKGFFLETLTSKVAQAQSVNTELPSLSPFNTQTVPLLAAAKNIHPNPSVGGAELLTIDRRALKSMGGISEGGISKNSDEKKSKNEDSEGGYSVYKVKEGDTLSQIASMYGVSVNTVRWANHIAADEYIHPGQMLLILPISGVQYTIEEGDTLRGIADRYGVSMDGILQYNKISDPSVITVGTKLVIPHGKKSQKIRNAGKPSAHTASPSHVSARVETYSAPVSSSGYFAAPLYHYIKTQGIHGHNGVDLAAPIGTPIHAAADGTVIDIYNAGGWNGGYGNYVVIRDSNGTKTVYAHMEYVSVGYGAVSQGEVIGAVGVTGHTTGPHLHFEVRGGVNPF